MVVQQQEECGVGTQGAQSCRSASKTQRACVSLFGLLCLSGVHSLPHLPQTAPQSPTRAASARSPPKTHQISFSGRASKVHRMALVALVESVGGWPGRLLACGAAASLAGVQSTRTSPNLSTALRAAAVAPSENLRSCGAACILKVFCTATATNTHNAHTVLPARAVADWGTGARLVRVGWRRRCHTLLHRPGVLLAAAAPVCLQSLSVATRVSASPSVSARRTHAHTPNRLDNPCSLSCRLPASGCVPQPFDWIASLSEKKSE
jgi:hypothetical protein